MLENLNPEQLAAVTTTDGPLLVLSGAGTGKTRVLTTRIAYILSQNLCAPWQIMALTFTNRAANEMKTRLGQMLGDGGASSDIWCGTFHSICLRILRYNAAAAGLRRDFLIYGEDDQKAILKTIFAEMGLDAKEYNPGDWVEKISAVKDRGCGAPAPVGRMADILDAYNARLATLNAIDFGDIILKTLDLFADNPDILARYQRQFAYILVDEFQDTNNAQMQFLTMLTPSGGAQNICCVGDDDQSIYSWRGAEIKHILNFDKTYPGAQIIRLETNYRSTATILGAANSLIRHNSGRLGKDLHAADAADVGDAVYVLTLPTDWDEARCTADTIMRHADGRFDDFAVLIRAGSLSRLFEEEFTTRGIPYRLVGATKFYDRMEIRDAVAYLRLLVHPFDDLSFLRVIAKPRRGFGPGAITKLRGVGGVSLMDALRAAPLSPKLRAAADAFLSAFDIDWGGMAPRDVATRLLNDVGYIDMWRTAKDADAPERLENIRDLIENVIAKYDTLPDFLEHAALMMTDDDAERDASANAVSIMTIHAAKGLEFNTVFLPAWEEGIFPNDMAISGGGLEEERRLAYVAITRARRRAIISNAMSRMVFGERKYNAPSSFINEMDPVFLSFQGVGAGASLRTTATRGVARAYGNAPRPRTPSVTTMVGKLVRHNDLGRGVVIEENGDILTIAFRDRGIKKVARQFIEQEA
ncbi:UvrD-helicase domain-containing protein [bacterium]|nr:UvrD-helicase domain-containing protein [bacterium]